MRHQLERDLTDEQRREYPDDERRSERHAAVSDDVEHLIAGDRSARAGSEPRVDAAKEKKAGDARRRTDQQGLEENFCDAAGCAGVLRPAECQPTGDTLCRAEQVVDGADGPRCQFAKHAPRPEPDIMQRTNRFFWYHERSVRNPCNRLQRHAQMTADFFRDTLTASSRKTARRKLIMAKKKSKAKKRLMRKSKRPVAKKKAVKKKAKSSSKAKTIAKKAAKPARKKVKAKPAPAAKKAVKKVARKKVAKPKTVAPVAAPLVSEPAPTTEQKPMFEPSAPSNGETSASRP